jgi:hypothetical protein
MEQLSKEELEQIISEAKADKDNPNRQVHHVDEEIEQEHECDDSCGCTPPQIPIVIARVLENRYRRLANQAKKGGKKKAKRR